jgi:hypothetical protein
MLLIWLMILSGCGSVEIKSHWRSNDVVIDGKNTGWFTSATALDDSRALVAVVNDEEYVYIGLRTADRDLERLMIREGVAVWFDRDGGSRKMFGIRPVSLGRPIRTLTESREGGMRDIASLVEGSATAFEEMEIFTSGEDQPQRMATLATGGIYARYHRVRDTLFYELRVPLEESGNHPFSISTKPGATLGVGLETSMIRPPMRSPGENGERGGRPEGGIGGKRGGGSGRGREGRPVNRPEGSARPDPLKVWCKLELASMR